MLWVGGKNRVITPELQNCLFFKDLRIPERTHVEFQTSICRFLHMKIYRKIVFGQSPGSKK